MVCEISAEYSTFWILGTAAICLGGAIFQVMSEQRLARPAGWGLKFIELREKEDEPVFFWITTIGMSVVGICSVGALLFC